MLRDVHTDGSQGNWFCEAAYGQDEQLLVGQPPGLLFFDHLIAVLQHSSSSFPTLRIEYSMQYRNKSKSASNTGWFQSHWTAVASRSGLEIQRPHHPTSTA